MSDCTLYGYFSRDLFYDLCVYSFMDVPCRVYIVRVQACKVFVFSHCRNAISLIILLVHLIIFSARYNNVNSCCTVKIYSIPKKNSEKNTRKKQKQVLLSYYIFSSNLIFKNLYTRSLCAQEFHFLCVLKAPFLIYILNKWMKHFYKISLGF